MVCKVAEYGNLQRTRCFAIAKRTIKANTIPAHYVFIESLKSGNKSALSLVQ
jgi:hypothetical protein